MPLLEKLTYRGFTLAVLTVRKSGGYERFCCEVRPPGCWHRVTRCEGNNKDDCITRAKDRVDTKLLIDDRTPESYSGKAIKIPGPNKCIINEFTHYGFRVIVRKWSSRRNNQKYSFAVKVHGYETPIFDLQSVNINVAHSRCLARIENELIARGLTANHFIDKFRSKAEAKKAKVESIRSDRNQPDRITQLFNSFIYAGPR